MNIFSPREDTYEALANALTNAYAPKTKRHVETANRPGSSAVQGLQTVKIAVS